VNITSVLHPTQEPRLLILWNEETSRIGWHQGALLGPFWECRDTVGSFSGVCKISIHILLGPLCTAKAFKNKMDNEASCQWYKPEDIRISRRQGVRTKSCLSSSAYFSYSWRSNANRWPVFVGRSGQAHFSTGTSNGIYCSRDQCVIYGANFDKHFHTNAYTAKSVPLQVVWTRPSLNLCGLKFLVLPWNGTIAGRHGDDWAAKSGAPILLPFHWFLERCRARRNFIQIFNRHFLLTARAPSSSKQASATFAPSLLT